MLLSIEPDSDVPIYLQLRNQIVAALVHGDLVEGDPLPSVRQLARDLGINLHTVNKVYKILEDEGYLKVRKRKGAVVTAPPAFDDDYLAQLETAVARLHTEASSHGIETSLFDKIVQQAIHGKRDQKEVL